MKKNIFRKKYPVHKKNKFSLHIDGKNYFSEILEAIKKAKWYIAIEMYLVEPGEMFNELIAALVKKADKKVYIFLVFDYYGSRQVYKTIHENLKHPFIFYKFFNKISISKLQNNIFRNHRKIFLIDSEIAYTGGTGITDSFFSTTSSKNLWHEVMIKIEGECIEDWVDLYFSHFKSRSIRKTQKKTTIKSILDSPIYTKSTAQLSQTGRVSYSRRFYYKDILRSTLKQIKLSKKKIYIVTAYFLPTWQFRRALKKAARRGVVVTLLLPGATTDHPSVRQMGRRYYQSLLSSGIQIFEYQPAFNHSKIFVCDDWVSIGSCNLDRWSLQRNLEANQEVFDEKFSKTVIKVITSDLKKSRQINLENWNYRSLKNRIYEKFWISAMTILESLFSPWRNKK